MYRKITNPPGVYDLVIPIKDEKCVVCNEILWKDENTKLEPVLTPDGKAVYVHQECADD